MQDNEPYSPEKSLSRPKPALFYGWIIVFLAFLTISTYGLFFSFPVFLETLEAELHASRAAISAVYTIYVIVYCLCSIPMGMLSDRFGPRKTLLLAALLIGAGISLSSLARSVWQLYLFFGVIAALGHGAIFVVPTSVLNRWFIRKRGLALGIAISGLGVGLLVIPPVASQIIGLYGWRVAFLALGVTFFTINLVVAYFIRGTPQDKGLQPLGQESRESNAPPEVPSSGDLTTTQAMKTRAFWLLYFLGLSAFTAEQMVLVHVVAYSTAMGMTPTIASLGLSSLGIGTIIGRIISGGISDRFGKIPTLVVCCAVEAVSIFLLLAVKAPASLYATMLFLGFGYGGWVVLCSLMLSDFFGKKNLGMITGAWFTDGVPAAIFGPLLGGIIFDMTRSYFYAFILAGTVSALSVVLALLIKNRPTLRLPAAAPKD